MTRACAMALGSRASQLFCRRVVGVNDPGKDCGVRGPAPAWLTGLPLGGALELPLQQGPGAAGVTVSVAGGTGGWDRLGDTASGCWGEVASWWLEWAPTRSPEIESLDVDSEMVWERRCFRWHRLRTSSDTDTKAARYGTDWGVTSNLSLKGITSELILGLRPANEIRCYKVTPSLIGCAQT